jgi:alkanesulfonate monooxygenase SsuD/methylene tetrahydromethanopterin reductase-like flavin-dependent oxidoreductase (luciferase family)
VGQSDEPRPAPHWAALQKGEAAVVEAAAHADSLASLVEAHQGHQEEVEMTRVDAATAGRRLRDAESV